MSELYQLSALEASQLLKSKKISSAELTESLFDRIDVVEKDIQAYLTLDRKDALDQAAKVDEKRSRGEALSDMAGIPIALKDNICTSGMRTTAGSKILYNFIPPYDAGVVSGLKQAGMVILGKTNCDEFAMGSSTENSGYHTTRNPWDLSRVPGGSSGGSAAAVASFEAPVALGSDTGGSIRQPAALCGVVGMKPTYGRVSRYGLIAYASSLDQIGPFGRTVSDCAAVLNLISGNDAMDSTSISVPVPDYLSACSGDVKGLKIGVPREFFAQGVSKDIDALVRAAIQKLCELGADAEECTLPFSEYALAAYYIIAPAEASSNLARFDGVKYGLRTKELAGHIGLTEKTRDEGFGDEVKQRIMIGTYALSAGYYDAYYKRAQQVRTLIRDDFDRAFEKYDILLTPTSPTTAFKIGEKSDPFAMKLADVCTLPVNMAGLPALSLPCGFSEGLPVGMQVIGKPFDEEMVFRISYAYEQASDWHKKSPVLAM